MKASKSFIYITIFTIVFSASNLFAGAINKDKLVGTWQISAEISADVPFKNWIGALTISRSGNSLTGVLDWSNTESGWHVKEKLAVSVKGNNINLQGTEIEVVTHAGGDIKYHLDNFNFSMDDVTEQTVPVSAADSQGLVANFTLTKS